MTEFRCVLTGNAKNARRNLPRKRSLRVWTLWLAWLYFPMLLHTLQEADGDILGCHVFSSKTLWPTYFWSTPTQSQPLAYSRFGRHRCSSTICSTVDLSSNLYVSIKCLSTKWFSNKKRDPPPYWVTRGQQYKYFCIVKLILDLIS